jgi:HPt (histidine-containing phosphotransfer) domain-containing protein
MTANAMAGDREKLLDAGMNDHIPKPIDVNGLFITMAKWIVPANPEKIANQKSKQVSSNTLDISFLSTLDEINVNDGLARTQNNQQLYLKLLLRFSDNQKDFIQRFEQAQTDEDTETCTRLIHTLKGLSGNIGASKLQKMAENVEIQNQSGVIKPDDWKKLKKSLKVVINTLNQLKNNETVQTSNIVESDVGEIQVILNSLKTMIANFDTATSDYLKQHQTILSTSVFASRYKLLNTAIDQYDYEKSSVIVDDMLMISNTM